MKVTREQLRAMSPGETKEFQLETSYEVESASATAYQLGRMEGCRYRCSKDYDNNKITITKYYD